MPSLEIPETFNEILKRFKQNPYTFSFHEQIFTDVLLQYSVKLLDIKTSKKIPFHNSQEKDQSDDSLHLEWETCFKEQVLILIQRKTSNDEEDSHYEEEAYLEQLSDDSDDPEWNSGNEEEIQEDGPLANCTLIIEYIVTNQGRSPEEISQIQNFFID